MAVLAVIWAGAAGYGSTACSYGAAPFTPVLQTTEHELSSANVYTYHYDHLRTGANSAETILTHANVNQATFGKLWSLPVDGYVYGEPLYVSGITVAGRLRNVLYVATENDSVYAFDADSGQTTPLWHTSFINPSAGITAVPSYDPDIVPQIGITSTPVIDPASETIYTVAFTDKNGTLVQRLHALNLLNGLERPGSPVVIAPTVPGNGPGSVNGIVTFDPMLENQRAGLLLVSGIVYIAWGAFADYSNYHGWIAAYNGQTLAQIAIFNDSPNSLGGGMWQAGDGLASDNVGDVFASTGNGVFDADTGGVDYGDTLLHLSPTLQVKQYFTPFNQLYLGEYDVDLSAGGLLLIPHADTGVMRLMVGADKDQTVYITKLNHMGGYTPPPGPDQIVQEFPLTNTPSGAIDSAPAYFNRTLYYSPTNGPTEAFTLQSNNLFNTTPTSTFSPPAGFTFPGPVPSVSANGKSSGIVWLIDAQNFVSQGPAVLYALNASNLAELYDSTQAGTRDQAGGAVKFTTATVANGKVFVGCEAEVTVYGLLP